MARPDPIAEELDKTGLLLSKGKREAAPYRPAILDLDPTSKRHPWWYANACARIGRILEGARPSLGTFSGGSSIESACKTAGHPKCAKIFLETWFYFMTRGRPAPIIGTDHNPFRNLPDREAYARWYQIVERICDASTGKLGTWRAGLSETGAARNRG